ncbi:MAG: DEAD/DEAH box helicase [Proteobacteria bacterium]|nr:DEAD/DEAH box helicase [Pseudomonadota bacterium]
MTFADLGLGEDLLRAVEDAGYTVPTGIQEAAIPYVLMGRDILACAQTGTGKTASFTLPMIDILAAGRARARMPRTLILEPTRELAAQVAENFETYGKYHKLSKALVIGGVSMDEQSHIIDRGVDVLIATPGRLIDHFDRGGLILNDVKILVIDEADRMLDMGFIPDVERIVSLLPKIRQTLLLSATMPKEIKRLADKFLLNPKEISVSPPASAAVNIVQNLITIRTGRGGEAIAKAKRDTLRKLMAQEDVKNALIFCNRKRDVDILAKSLKTHGFNTAALHGDMAQSVRTETMESFKNDEISLLVCSDVAARGLDISGLSHVFLFDVPTHPEDYVHRIGRTGRAGMTGRAFTLATKEDDKFLASIERMMGTKIPRFDISEAAKTTDAPVAAKDAVVPDTETAPTESTKKPAQRASKPRRGRGKTAEEPVIEAVQDAPKEQVKAERAKPAKKPVEATSDDSPIIGLGDHMPAFLLRDPKVTAKSAKKPRATAKKQKTA